MYFFQRRLSKVCIFIASWQIEFKHYLSIIFLSLAQSIFVSFSSEYVFQAFSAIFYISFFSIENTSSSRKFTPLMAILNENLIFVYGYWWKFPDQLYPLIVISVYIYTLVKTEENCKQNNVFC